MGTSNFYYRNASKVFVIAQANEIDDIIDYQMELDDITEMLKMNKGSFNFIKYNECNSMLDNRNFPASYIGTLYSSKCFGDINFEIEINCFSRAGYYEAACLDWELKLLIDDDICDDIRYISEMVLDCTSFMNRGMLKIQARKAEKWCEQTKNDIVKLVEGIFTKSSETYIKMATASNGESYYEKCEVI